MLPHLWLSPPAFSVNRNKNVTCANGIKGRKSN
jgi:hypothetical protein